MYCSSCGAHLRDDSTFCPECGASITDRTNKKEETNICAIIGFILSVASVVPLVVSSIAGLILSIIALKRANEGYGQKGLAIAGIIFSGITLLMGVLLVNAVIRFLPMLRYVFELFPYYY